MVAILYDTNQKSLQGGIAMKKFEAPRMEVEIFEIEDILTTSGNPVDTAEYLELPDEPFSQLIK